MLNAVFPALNALDAALAPLLPAWARLVLVGVLSGALSMGLYRLVSNQAGIKAQKVKLQEIQGQLRAAGDDLALTMRLSRQNIAVAMGLLGRSLVPAIVSSLPVVFIIAWLAVHWSYAAPLPGTAVPVAFVPAATAVSLEPAGVLTGEAGDRRLVWPDPATVLRLAAADAPLWSGTAADLATTGEVGRPPWWSVLLGNPAGYLPADGPLDSMRVELPRQEFLGVGPWWMRGWEFLYFLTVVVVSLGVKFVFKIA